MEVTLPLVLSTGLIDSFNPCAISLLLLYIALMYGMKKSHKTIMVFGFFYILALYLTYFFIGLGLLQVLHLFGSANLVSIIGGAIAILFGLLNIKEYYFPDLPIHIRIPMNYRQKAGEWAHKATIPAAVVLGVLVGLFEFPCSGAVYIAIIGYLRAQETFLKGIGYLAIYNVMFVLPLLIIYALASNRIITEKMINWQEQFGRRMHLVLAGLMILLGVFLIYTSL